MATVGEIADIMNAFAPEQSAYDFDNVGLLTGDRAWEFQNVLLTLDVTSEIIEEAINREAQMIISHHPIFFHPVKSITANTVDGRIALALIQNRIALYASHTPLDATEGGVNDTLCALLGLENIKGFELMYENPATGQQFYCSRIGYMPEAVPLAVLVQKVKTVLDTQLLKTVPSKKETVQKIAVCTGAGGIGIEEVILQGADVYITGELKYHDALLLAQNGIAVIEAGHYETEAPVINSLFVHLQKETNRLQYNIKVMKPMTCTNPYRLAK